MVDREKVIKGLEKCKRCECDDCTEKGASQAPWDCPAYDNFVDSALALLKEQETVKPEVYCVCQDKYKFYRCPVCKTAWYYKGNYCLGCGRLVKWNE